MAGRSVMRRTQCSDGGGNSAARHAAPGKLARIARVAPFGPPRTQGATHYYIVFLSTLARFIFSPTQAALALPTAPAVQTLTQGHGAAILIVEYRSKVLRIAENFLSRRWGRSPRRQIFLVILQERLRGLGRSAIVRPVGWLLVSQS